MLPASCPDEGNTFVQASSTVLEVFLFYLFVRLIVCLFMYLTGLIPFIASNDHRIAGDLIVKWCTLLEDIQYFI